MIHEEAAMYKSNQPTLKDFYDFVLTNPKHKKSYFQIASTNIRIPSDTIIHDVKKHGLTYEQLEDFLWNLDKIENAGRASKNINGAPTYLLRVCGQVDYGATLMLGRENSVYFNTIFIDHSNSIDNWIKEGSRTQNAAQPTDSSRHNNDSVAISGLDPNNIINYVKGKIKMSESKETLLSILEKLKKYIIEPEPEVLFDDMEDDTGLNGTGIEECMTAAQMGPAPTPNLGRKSIVKSDDIDDIKKELEDIDEDINGNGKDATQTIIEWLDKLNFKPTKYDKGIRYIFDGNYNHYIISNNNRLHYQINNKGKVIYKEDWIVNDSDDVSNAFKQISKVLDSYE